MRGSREGSVSSGALRFRCSIPRPPAPTATRARRPPPTARSAWPARALRPLAVWVTAAPEPTLVRVANIQHLARPIRAQLASPVTAIELAGALHPTPAVGGEPREHACRLIPALEGLDRGWYAGA